MFKNLDTQELEIIIQAMEILNFNAGDTIIKQGEDGNHMYVVETGELECSKLYVD
jgi:cAMP-dependent protein kinase regulator